MFIAIKHQVCADLFSQVKQIFKSFTAAQQYGIDIPLSYEGISDSDLTHYVRDDAGFITRIDIIINNQFHPFGYCGI